MSKEDKDRDATAFEEQVAEHSQADSQEQSARAANGDTRPAEQAPERSGTDHKEGRESPLTHVGPYKIVKRIGEGDAGIVFQAEQQEPVHLPVALKIIKEGMDWKRIVARFEADRQALSRMDHPHIAKMLGAGTRQSGQPYFVMELVEGLPLPKYCDEHQLSLRERLELFVSVCLAVQYAHQKGIIHGHLKPSNVLVADQEDKPAPKILDFGVARAMRRKPDENDPSADLGDLGVKPEYLSPDQAAGNVLDRDTRNDVYSLGVLLYELLTGTTPLTPERLKDVPRTDALQLIREEEVMLPSSRLDESKERLASVAAKRQMKPAALIKAVRGELDCLTLKALRKNREQRYQTVHDLTREVQRYLAKETVEACPPSPSRQVWNLTRKHTGVFAAVVLVLFLLLAAAGTGAGLTLWAFHKEHQAQKAEQEAVEKQKKAEKSEEKIKGQLHMSEEARKVMTKERDRAREEEKTARRSEGNVKAMLAFFKDNLLSAGRPAEASLAKAFWEEGKGKDVTLKQAVDAAAARVADAFMDRPQAEAAIRELLGSAYLDVGEASPAVEQYKRALALREAIMGTNDPQTADCRNKLAVAYRLAGQIDKAGRLFNQSPPSPARAKTLAVRGATLLSEKKFVEAELRLRESLTIRQQSQSEDWTTFDTKSMLGEALLEQKKYADAEPLLRSGYQGMKQRQDKIPSQDKNRLTKALDRLARLYKAWGKEDEAARWRKELEAAKDAKKP